MCDKIFEKINELKNDEDNYIELKAIESRFEAKIDPFIGEKVENRRSNEEKLKKIVAEIKKIGRIAK